MDERNVIAAYHIMGSENGALVLNTDKLFYWHIHKHFRRDEETPIQKGDIVQVATAKGPKPVLVMDVFREETSNNKKKHKQVMNIIERAPEGSSQSQALSSDQKAHET